MSKVGRSGLRTTLAGNANADIVTSIVEGVRARVLQGACTFMVKVKAHRGEPLNEDMLRGGAEYQMQRDLNRAVDNWIKIFM
jgi:hypothetical protein